MKLIIIFLFCLFSVTNTLGQHHLEVEGQAKITLMSEVDTAGKIVVRLSGGTLGIRDLSTMGDADSDPTNEIETWSTLAGIPADFSDNVDDIGIAFETDPQVGLVTNGRWCISDGIKVNCTQQAPDTDPSNEIQNLSSVLSESNDGGSTQIKNIADPTAAQDAATKAYVDNILVPFAISIGSAGIQGLLNAGYSPSEIINAGVSKDSLYGKTYPESLIYYLDDSVSLDYLAEKLNDLGDYEYPKVGQDKSRLVGVSAREVVKVLHEVVPTNRVGYDSLEYGKLSNLLMVSIKEQQKIITEQKFEIESLTDKLTIADGLKEENDSLRERLNKIETHLNISENP